MNVEDDYGVEKFMGTMEKFMYSKNERGLQEFFASDRLLGELPTRSRAVLEWWSRYPAQVSFHHMGVSHLVRESDA